MKVLNALKLGLDEKFYEESPVVAMESQGQAICCRKRFRVTWWCTPRESAGDGAVYALHVSYRKPPIGTLPVNQEGTAHYFTPANQDQRRASCATDEHPPPPSRRPDRPESQARHLHTPRIGTV